MQRIFQRTLLDSETISRPKLNLSKIITNKIVSISTRASEDNFAILNEDGDFIFHDIQIENASNSQTEECPSLNTEYPQLLDSLPSKPISYSSYTTLHMPHITGKIISVCLTYIYALLLNNDGDVYCAKCNCLLKHPNLQIPNKEITGKIV